MTDVKTAWYKTWLATALVAGIVGMGVSGCNLGSGGAESKREKATATATQASVDNKTTGGASEKKTEVAETTATSDPAPSSERAEKSGKKTRSKETKSDSSEKSKVHYKNCEEAKKAGAAPLRVGDPGYRSGLDRDGDGIACEK